MPSFELSARADAPVEEVWKLLHNPDRFPEWWAGVETVSTQDGDRFTLWPTGYPDFPMSQRLRAEQADTRVTISCLVSDLEYRWQLRESGEATYIDVHVHLPEKEAHRLATQRRLTAESISRLAALAAGSRSG